jgi:hypothetical protein
LPEYGKVLAREKSVERFFINEEYFWIIYKSEPAYSIRDLLDMGSLFGKGSAMAFCIGSSSGLSFSPSGRLFGR